eukprot:COSAG02_NODE_5403_length_4357_cov_3.183185_3_plen_151_part_00
MDLLHEANNSAISAIVRAAEQEGSGLLIIRNQTLRPRELEAVLKRFSPYFGPLAVYERWAGQSKHIPDCPHLSVLGNYRAKSDGECDSYGLDCTVGERVGEFKPASISSIDEWHTDDSFEPKPKVAIGLYSPAAFANAVTHLLTRLKNAY